MNGGIPSRDIESMKEYWKVYPSVKELLFKPFRNGYVLPAVEKDDIVNTITSHPEFVRHANVVDSTYLAWKAQVTSRLMNLNKKDDPKAIINEISESLLSAFSDVPLIDKYDVYQS